MRNIPEVKLLLVGDSGVGKTAFVTRFLTGEFPSRYVPTVGVDVNPLEFHTNFGPICFECWDTAGHDDFDDRRSGCYMNAQCAIIMFDVTSRITLQNVTKWYREIVRVCGEIPIVLCGNKVDAADSRARVKHLNLDRTIRLPYFEISAAAQRTYGWDGPFAPFDNQLEDPLEWLTRRLSGDENLKFMEQFFGDPPPEITPEEIALLETAAAPLPDEDDDL